VNRLILGALCALTAVAVGLFWWQGRAQVERGAPPPSLPALRAPSATDLPTADVGNLRGPELPRATDLTKEQQRFGRYDRDRDGEVSRVEMLSTRTDAFRKLDKDRNNLLTFEEWAVATVGRFEGADRNGDDRLNPAEFATTKPKRPAKARCAC